VVQKDSDIQAPKGIVKDNEKGVKKLKENNKNKKKKEKNKKFTRSGKEY